MNIQHLKILFLELHSQLNVKVPLVLDGEYYSPRSPDSLASGYYSAADSIATSSMGSFRGRGGVSSAAAGYDSAAAAAAEGAEGSSDEVCFAIMCRMFSLKPEVNSLYCMISICTPIETSAKTCGFLMASCIHNLPVSSFLYHVKVNS